jgi:hypothetical protein
MCVTGFSSTDPTRSLKGARGNPLQGNFLDQKATVLRKRRNKTALNPLKTNKTAK